ncbi:MAG: phosphoribosylanthranilate isomerase [Gemmatimonadota bacterium]|nr:phosphoribosylanthranilate isomerase [Gemmatimonadota bacterium]
MTRIKFCGITRREDAVVACELGATHLGVIFAESPRKVSPLQASEVFSAAPGMRRVGVFRHSPIGEILDAAQGASLDVIQMHGRFSLDDVARLREGFDGELWSVLPVEAGDAAISEDVGDMSDLADAILLDTMAHGQSGGTGTVFNWEAARSLVRELAGRTTVVLAGGLNPGNVADAIRILRPAIVDVSSGVESSPGIKDHSRMKAFAEAVASASIV